MQTNLEQVVLRHILTDEQYMRAVLPYIKPDYFEGIYRILFKEAGKFVAKYNKLPNAEAFKIQLDETESLSEEQYKLAIDILPNLFSEEEVNSLCRYSEHPLSISIHSFLKDKKVPYRDPDRFEVVPGRGIKGQVNDSHFLIGSETFLKEEKVNLPDNITSLESNTSKVYISQNKKIFLFSKKVRSNDTLDRKTGRSI